MPAAPKCYACDASATGSRDFTYLSGGNIKPACTRHRDDTLKPWICPCGTAVRKGSVEIDGQGWHAKCHAEACAD